MRRNTSSERRPAFQRPTVLIGADATMLGRPAVTAAQAAGAGLYGIDLDLRRSWRPTAEVELDRLATTRLRSVWLPAHYTGPLAERRGDRLRAFLTHAVAHNGLRTVILPNTSGGRSQGVAIGPLARQAASVNAVRVAVAADAGEIMTRPGSHLDHVANLRRLAEEWDLDIALDLTSDQIDAWEAEATLMRLFPRLTLVRLRPLHDISGSHAHISPSTIARRSIAMLADQAYAGLISIKPGHQTSPWLSWIARPSAELAGAARLEILQTYDRIDHYDMRAPETNPRPW